MKSKSLIVITGVSSTFLVGCMFIAGINNISENLNPSETSQPSLLQATEIINPGIQASIVENKSISTTLEIFKNTNIPVYDPIELAERLEQKTDLPLALEYQDKSYRIGDHDSFWVMDSESNENVRVQATLEYITEHVYFWVDDGVRFNSRDIADLVNTFENNIYPTTRAFFGSEWTPGVDADPHLFILYVKSLGGPVAGYFSSADEFLPLVRRFSNGHEMFLLSNNHVSLDEEYAYSVLAHEFQHMIHWYRDRNEEIWLNEGASSLASFLNGYAIGGHDQIFALNPNLQLNDWPNDNENNAGNYGASFLFMAYFLDRFGEEVTRSLIEHPANGLDSIDQTLADHGFQNPSTGRPLDADDFFLDWLITNYVQDERVFDGRYSYINYTSAPRFDTTHEISQCPKVVHAGEVYQYGVNSLQINCQGKFLLRFDGSEQVPVLSSDPHSGNFAFYSNRGDESDTTLTREFDFSNISGPLTLSYWTWYDLEEDYDYIYLEASHDGSNWQILSTPSGTSENKSGNSYGWGYNGLSGGGPYWIHETVDISQFSGQRVFLRFEYITDSAVNGEGFLLDDISIAEFSYFSDFEPDDGGWLADGFVRIQNKLPQTFRLALIQKGRETSVQTFATHTENYLELPIEIGNSSQETILIISGTTRFTRQKAKYTLSITQD